MSTPLPPLPVADGPRVQTHGNRTDATAPLRVHETFEGQGRAYDGARLLAEAEYLLQDVEEVHRVAPFPGETGEQMPGQRGLYGIIKTPETGLLAGFVGARLELALDDGRRLPFTVVKVTNERIYLIQGLGEPQHAPRER